MGVNPEGESIKPEDEDDETQGEENGTKVQESQNRFTAMPIGWCEL
jgi:hypothetical protein